MQPFKVHKYSDPSLLQKQVLQSFLKVDPGTHLVSEI